MRDDLRDYVTGQLGDTDAVLVVDETGDLKKGVYTVGVQRQYTGTAGRIENAQVAVYLAYAGERGHAMIDRELYLPKSWTDDPDRAAREAGVPDDIEFLTKPALATGMIIRALNAGVPARWVAGDEVYGADPALRAELELRRIGYVLAIGCDRRVPTAAGPLRADQIAAGLPRRAWQRLSAGAGAKGQRYYDWAWVAHPDPTGSTDPTDPVDTQCWWLLVRRHRHTGELAFYRCYSPQPVPLRELVRVAGRRWTVEESFQAGKGLAGLDEHQVRRWTSWQRWTLLAMIAHALLAVIAAHEHTTRPAPDGLIALTCSEIRRLFTIYVIEPSRTLACPMAWSPGDDATNTAPAPATTSAKKPPDHGHNDLRLEYLRHEALCLYPSRSGEELEEYLWARWLTWIRKVKGTIACQETSESGPGVRDGALGDPRDMAKAGLPDIPISRR